jgi:3-hydroxyisobutyrate dehydrogenase-like beta-hydroxyacid dehydrogenase
MEIGFVGVGQMGRHMAANLLARGHDLTICDRRPEARVDPLLTEASWVETPSELGPISDIVISSLPGPDEVAEVALGDDGLLQGMRPGGLYIDMSTSTPESIREIATAAEQRDVNVVDAPVAGGVRGARKGTLTIMVGAAERDFEHARPVLECMGSQIFLVGSVGAGHTAKLVNNIMTIANGLAAMEAMVLGAKAGLDVEKLLEVVQAGTGASFSLNLFPYVVFPRNFDPPKFALSLAAKDLRIAVEAAGELGVPMPVVAGASKVLTTAAEAAPVERDWTSYITTIEAPAGVEVRPS